MITKGNVRALVLGLLTGSTILVVQHLWGDVPARWWAASLLLVGLIDIYLRRTSRSGWWITRGVDSEVGEPCWLVKGGPYSGEDDTVAELGTWLEARRYITRMERLTTEAYRRSARG
ncbi:hypothetical protein [Streptomyces tendae]|uniref:hypothetical protein n=1 Tax=Streptomyces tendae TaxID=1932 RepID=UPI00324EA171